MYSIVKHTKATRIALVKAVYGDNLLKDELPYLKVIYENDVVGDIRYTQKYNKFNVDDTIIEPLKQMVKNGEYRKYTNELPDGQQKDIWVAEGVVMAAEYHIVNTNNAMFFLHLNYQTEIRKFTLLDKFMVNLWLKVIKLLFILDN